MWDASFLDSTYPYEHCSAAIFQSRRHPFTAQNGSLNVAIMSIAQYLLVGFAVIFITRPTRAILESRDVYDESGTRNGKRKKI